jgi:hypothetical protein
MTSVKTDSRHQTETAEKSGCESDERRTEMIERTIRSKLMLTLGIILLESGSLAIAYEEAPPPSGFLADYSRLAADLAEPGG